VTSQRSAAEMADDAYEAVRALNHATFPAQCELAGHEELYRVLGSLAALLHITPQALRQAAAGAARAQQAGRVAVDAASPAGLAETVAGIERALAQAACLAARAARHADAAHQAAAHLNTDPDNRPRM